ncbi:MAG TPA: FliA/WhiG family RNA polymerase sigma factor [Clostridia bacterium]|nr:FliA/WhiG family RNA polymerase sigma factor [Clostridia bacterium]
MNSVHVAYEEVLDREERDRLLMEQLPQVRYIARRIHDRLPQHVLLEDLVHAGVLGLMDALQKYDHRKNVQFKSYAKFRIRGAILDSLRELDWSPRDLRRKARRLEQANSKLGTELGRSASEMELAAELGMDLDEFQHMLTELGGLDLGSLQIESSQDGHEEDLCEYLPGNPEESPYFLCLRSEMKALLATSISEMSEKEQQVLSLYYYEELTMKEVGAVLGVGESRVSQIHSLAMIRLRSRLQEMPGTRTTPAALTKGMQSIMGGSWKRS